MKRCTTIVYTLSIARCRICNVNADYMSLTNAENSGWGRIKTSRWLCVYKHFALVSYVRVWKWNVHLNHYIHLDTTKSFRDRRQSKPHWKRRARQSCCFELAREMTMYARLYTELNILWDWSMDIVVTDTTMPLFMWTIRKVEMHQFVVYVIWAIKRDPILVQLRNNLISAKLFI